MYEVHTYIRTSARYVLEAHRDFTRRFVFPRRRHLLEDYYNRWRQSIPWQVCLLRMDVLGVAFAKLRSRREAHSLCIPKVVIGISDWEGRAYPEYEARSKQYTKTDQLPILR